MRLKLKIWALFPPFNFSVHCQIVPSERQMSLQYGSVTPAVSSGSGTVGRRWPFRAHQGTDVSTLPWTGTIFRNMLQKRSSIKGDYTSGRAKPPVCSGHKISSSHSRRHWLGRWSFLIDSVQSSSFHKGNKLLFIIDGKPLWSRSSKKPSYEKLLWSSMWRNVLDKQSFLIGSGKPLCYSFICEQSIQRRSGMPRMA